MKFFVNTDPSRFRVFISLLNFFKIYSHYELGDEQILKIIFRGQIQSNDFDSYSLPQLTMTTVFVGLPVWSLNDAIFSTSSIPSTT